MSKKVRFKDLELIDATEVPERKYQRGIDWEEIFSKIPSGKAAVIQPEQLHSSTVRTALKRFQKRGKFTNLFMTTRKIAKGKYVSYVANQSPTDFKQNE